MRSWQKGSEDDYSADRLLSTYRNLVKAVKLRSELILRIFRNNLTDKNEVLLESKIINHGSLPPRGGAIQGRLLPNSNICIYPKWIALEYSKHI